MIAIDASALVKRYLHEPGRELALGAGGASGRGRPVDARSDWILDDIRGS